MKNSHPVMTGIAAAAVVGTAAYMLSNSSKKSAQHTGRTIKRNTGKALKTVGSLMENMSYMMK